MREWFVLVSSFLDEFPSSTSALMSLVLVSAAAFMVFLAVYSGGEQPEAAENYDDAPD